MPPASLPEIERACWRELHAAVADRTHPWRTPVLATRDGDGADARTVVLRAVDETARTLRFFTDARSPKAAQLAVHPLGTVVAWSAALQWQLRLRVRLRRQDDPSVTGPLWQRLAGSRAAGDYLAALAPGAPLEGAATAGAGAPHFAVLDAQLLSMDWLALDATGHRRACFDAQGARWLQP